MSADHSGFPADVQEAARILDFADAALNAILGAALLFVSGRKSQSAGAIAAVVATFLIFIVVVAGVTNLVLGMSAHLNWETAIYLAIATSILAVLLLPWSWSANRRVLVSMALTFGALTVLFGSLPILARL